MGCLGDSIGAGLARLAKVVGVLGTHVGRVVVRHGSLLQRTDVSTGNLPEKIMDLFAAKNAVMVVNEPLVVSMWMLSKLSWLSVSRKLQMVTFGHC